MNVTDSSREAYRSLRNVLTQEQRIVLLIHDIGHDATIAEIARMLGWEKSTVSARMNSLKRRGEIVFSCRRIDSETGMRNEAWRLR